MSRLDTDVAPGFSTYEMIFQEDCWPVQTFQLWPATLAVPVCEPNGCTPPRLFSQIIISVPSGWPLVVGVELNQMSYATSYAPDAGWLVLHDEVALARLLTWIGRPLPVVQAPQWQPL